jgi:hypothetical protein
LVNLKYCSEKYCNSLQKQLLYEQVANTQLKDILHYRQTFRTPPTTMSSDAHEGGDLSDMAASGTKIPNDAGNYETLPSVPHPTQKAENPAFHAGFIDAPDQQGATDNVADMPRAPKDTGVTGEVISGTGDQMPPGVESKRLGMQDAGGPAAKGHPRDGKAVGDKGSMVERAAVEGAEVEPAPGEEEDSQDAIRDRKGL